MLESLARKMVEKGSREVDEGLKLAIEAAGGLRALARLLRITHNSIMKWERIPADHIIEIERLTGVARERLRPDLYRRR